MQLTEIDTEGRTSGQIHAFCPKCHKFRTHQSNKSLSVNLDDGAFSCHNCGEKGRLDEFRGKAYVSKERRNYTKPGAAALQERAQPLPEEALAYFRGRGISEATLKEWTILCGPVFKKLGPDGKQVSIEGVPQYYRALKFPYFESGELVNVKCLTPKEWTEDGERRFQSVRDAKPIPFGLDRYGDEIAIVEGEIDALSLYEAGITNVWSVPNGAKNVQWLDFEVVVDRLLRAKRIYIAVDNDKDGHELRDELVHRLRSLVGIERLAIVNWPDEIKDANDALRTYGPDWIKERVEAAETIPIDGITTIDDFYASYLDVYDHGVPTGVSTGIPGLDPIYKVMPGMFTILTGYTNRGKSEVMDEVVRLMNAREGWKFAFYSPENAPLSLHGLKLAEKYIGAPYDKERPGAMSREDAIEAAEWMRENLFWIDAGGKRFSTEEILERARVLIYRHGIKGLIIDPWNYVKKEFGGLREDQYINEKVGDMVAFTRETGCHIFLSVHPRTPRRDKDGKLQTLNVYDLSGGSKFADNADFILVVDRDMEKAKIGIHEVTIKVEKSRYRYAAQIGECFLNWNPFNGRFDPSSNKTIVLPRDEHGEVIRTENPFNDPDDDADYEDAA